MNDKKVVKSKISYIFELRISFTMIQNYSISIPGFNSIPAFMVKDDTPVIVRGF